MASKAVNIESLSLPLAIIQASPGLGIDFGSTLIKIVFRDKSDFHNGQPLHKEISSCLKMVSFPTAEVDEVMEFILNHADITRASPDTPTLICCTGNAGTIYQKRIHTQLNVRMRIGLECEMFVRSFRVLSQHLSQEDFLHPIPERAIKEGSQVRGQFQAWMARTKESLKDLEYIPPPPGTPQPVVEIEKQSIPQDVPSPPVDAGNSVQIPCLIVSAGSAFLYIMVNESGTYTVVDNVEPGGLTFLGLAHQLTGLKDYNEMLSLAAAANGRSLDVYASEFPDPPPGEEYPIYTWQGIDFNCFPFAKGLHLPQGGASVGDSIFSLYNLFCHQLNKMARLNARIFKIKHIYFCGNFVNSELARFNIIRHQLSNVTDITNPIVEEEEYLFPRHGGMYGAIGAFLYTDEK